MKVRASTVFSIDWTNLDEVKKLADKLGPGMSVYKHPDRQNYNIIHSVKENTESGVIIVYRT